MINTLRPHAAQLLVALKKTIPAVLLLGSLSLGLAPSARAQITLTFQENGSDVLASYSGDWGLFNDSFISDGPEIGASTFFFTNLGDTWSFEQISFTAVTLPLPLSVLTGLPVGDSFGFNNNFIYAPAGYDVGDGLSGSLSLLNTSFSALGMTVGESGVIDYGSGNIVNWSVSAVPEPSTYAAFLGLAAMGFAATRRRRRAA